MAERTRVCVICSATYEVEEKRNRGFCTPCREEHRAKLNVIYQQQSRARREYLSQPSEEFDNIVSIYSVDPMPHSTN